MYYAFYQKFTKNLYKRQVRGDHSALKYAEKYRLYGHNGAGKKNDDAEAAAGILTLRKGKYW
jgi:hypothetical protein